MFIGFRNGNCHFAKLGIRGRVVAFVAWALGITIHINGVPFGACNHETDDLMQNPAIEWQR